MFVEPTPGIIRAVSVATDALIQINAVETSSEPLNPRYSWLRVYERDDLGRFSSELLETAQQVLAQDSPFETVATLIHEWKESALAVASGVLDEGMHHEGNQEIELPHPSSMPLTEV